MRAPQSSTGIRLVGISRRDVMLVSRSPLLAPLPSASARAEFGRTGIVLHLLVPTMVFFQFIYSLSFNLLPDDIRLAFAGILSIGHGILALYALLRHGKLGSFMILVAAIAMVAAWSVGIVFLGAPFDFKAMSRDLTPHLAAIWMLTLAFAMPRRFLGFLSVASLAIGGVLARISQTHLGGVSSGADEPGCGSICVALRQSGPGLIV